MPMNPPDRTIGTRVSAKIYDVERMQSIREQSQEEGKARERTARQSGIVMAIATLVGISVFILLWWLVVR